MVTEKPSVPGFELGACIGKGMGGFANIFSAKHLKDKNNFALRICPLDHPNISLECIEREVSILKSLNHSNILSCLKSFTKDNLLVLTSPLMEYGSVTDMIHSHFLFGLPEMAICMIVFDILRAINYIHSRDLIHRGIRSSHILISADGMVKLSGFRNAISTLKNGKRQAKVFHFGPELQPNLLWLAPEVLQQNMDGYCNKSDLYSLGITVCEMANGFPPFSDMEQMQMLMEKLRGTTPRLLDCTTLAPAPEGDNEVGAEQRRRQFSSHFHSFTDCALKPAPSIRPSPQELLQHAYFKQIKKTKSKLPDILAPLKPMTGSINPSASTDQKLSLHSSASTSWDFFA